MCKFSSNLKRIDIKSDNRSGVFTEFVDERIILRDDLGRIPDVQLTMLSTAHQQPRRSNAAINSIRTPHQFVKPAQCADEKG